MNKYPKKAIKMYILLRIILVKIWGEQPTIRIVQGSDLDHLRRETNVTGWGEATQNASDVAMKS